MVAEWQCHLCPITSHFGDSIQLVGVNSGHQECQRWLKLFFPVPCHSPVMLLSLSLSLSCSHSHSCSRSCSRSRSRSRSLQQFATAFCVILLCETTTQLDWILVLCPLHYIVIFSYPSGMLLGANSWLQPCMLALSCLPKGIKMMTLCCLLADDRKRDEAFSSCSLHCSCLPRRDYKEYDSLVLIGEF